MKTVIAFSGGMDSTYALYRKLAYSDDEVTAALESIHNDANNIGTHKLDLKANIASPTFTGTPAAPTPASNDNSTRIATTSYTVSYVTSALGNYYNKTTIDSLQTKWGTSQKFVQSTEPTSAVNGDFWFKI